MRALVVLCVLGVPAIAAADLRSLTHTYEYSTQSQGTTSIQLWHTGRRVASDRQDALDYRVEIEHGVLEHLDVSITTVLAQQGGNALAIDRLTFASRYRFADRAEWPVDLAVALEGGKLVEGSIYPIALRVIAARDFDRLTIAANAIAHARVGYDLQDDVETALGWAGAVTYALHDRVRAGVETYGETAKTETEAAVLVDSLRASVGPVLSLNPTAKFWISVGVGFGVTDEADDVTVRGIIGIEL